MRRLGWAFFLVLFSSFAEASSLTVAENVYAQKDNTVTAADLVHGLSLDVPFKEKLSKIIWDVKFQDDQYIDLNSKDVVKKIRNFRELSWAKHQLIMPKKVRVFSWKSKFSKERIQQIVEKQVLINCETCKVKLRWTEGKLPVIDDFSPWEFESPENGWKGRVRFDVTQKDKSYKIPLYVEWVDRVLVARRSLRAGHTLSKNDFEWKTTNVTFSEMSLVRNKKQALGLKLRRRIQKGEVFVSENLVKPQIVRFGQPLRAIDSAGTFRIVTSALARGSGAAGDRIPILIQKTKKKVMAEIIDKGTVRL